MEEQKHRDIIPDDLLEVILHQMTAAKDAASCACVCKDWRNLISRVPKLCFGRTQGDSLVTKMISKTGALEELVVHGPFSAEHLKGWIAHTQSTLKTLELRLESDSSVECVPKLEYITSALQLRNLSIWGGSISTFPSSWEQLKKLQTLQIVGARFNTITLGRMLLACPMLKDLALIGCSGVKSLTLEMQHLEKCKLDFSFGLYKCRVSIRSPKLTSLEVQGASSLFILDDRALQHLIVARNGEFPLLDELDVGKLPVLKTLELRGIKWRWPAVDYALRSSAALRELVFRIEFCGDDQSYQRLPAIDLTSFLSNHPNLKVLEAHGGMFASLLPINQVPDNSFSLEEVVITVRSPRNWPRKYQVLQSIILCNPRLKKMVLRTASMVDEDPDNFFGKIMELQRQFHFITVE